MLHSTPKRKPRCVLLVGILLVCLTVLSHTTAAQTLAVESAFATHVLNLTLAGASNGWPQSTEALSPTTAAVTTAVCGSLPSNVGVCEGFLMTVSTGVIGLQVSVQTASAAASATTYQTLLGWSRNVNPPLEAIRTAAAQALAVTALDPLSYRSGDYVMPCRSTEVYEFLPVCQTGEQPNTVLYVANASGSTGLQNYFRDKICGDATVDCSSVTIDVASSPSESEYTVVNITGAGTALEAVLSYVADVRAQYVRALVVANPGMIAVTGPGNPDGGVAASAVEMRHTGMVATLFSTQENSRYDQGFPITPNCPTNTGLWALALLALLPILMFTYLWVRHRGRKRSKKHQRKLIIEDELRIMQGYAGGGTGAGAGDQGNQAMDAGAYGLGGDGTGAYNDMTAMGPPPGTEYPGMMTPGNQGASGAEAAGGEGTVWMMGEDGNYYEIPASTYETGQTQDEGQTPAAQAGEGDDTANEYADPNAENTQYQTYVDPETGEMYQYAYDPAQAANEGQGEEEVQVDNEAPQDGNAAAAQYDTYIDPTTGETYQYDPNAVAAEDQGEAAEQGQDGVEMATYVDPNTGETYQYDASAAADGGEAGGLQMYVDPETGETYQYDPNAVAEEQQ